MVDRERARRESCERQPQGRRKTFGEGRRGSLGGGALPVEVAWRGPRNDLGLRACYRLRTREKEVDYRQRVAD